MLSSPLTGVGSSKESRLSTTQAIVENGTSHQIEAVDDSGKSGDDGRGNDVIVEKVEVNGEEQDLPKKKTRRGKRKSKTSQSSSKQVRMHISRYFKPGFTLT